MQCPAPPPRRGRSSRGETGLFYNKLPVPGAGKRPVTWLHSIFYQHGCTGLAGREVSAPEAGWGDDPVRACGCPGSQANHFRKKSCLSMSISLFALEVDTRRRESQGVISCPRWTILQPVFLHPNPGAFPLGGSRTPSFFVSLRRPSCAFVDSSFLFSAVVSAKQFCLAGDP